MLAILYRRVAWTRYGAPAQCMRRGRSDIDELLEPLILIFYSIPKQRSEKNSDSNTVGALGNGRQGTTAIYGFLCSAIWSPAHSYALLLVFAFLISTSCGTFSVTITAVMVEVDLNRCLRTLRRFVLLWLFPPLMPAMDDFRALDEPSSE
ncbi:hypothetical protein N7517_002251 [Penicillium concentricum]|uniref:Uncharacterized protein n=1 Tax=Penicillium concentricum TaxID=293559 RepID=A0A9W9VLC9_9EURO|nr:uncharacterized protein N7517_002251 [Penicillium concentricum]KAJ5384340.1 hypothetical protein N7517_002251 [Penicillium concentricum]